MKGWKVVPVLLVGLLLVSASQAARADMIGVNFAGGGGGVPPASLSAADSAGVVPQTNFNNLSFPGGTDIALVDNNGAATTATLTFSSTGGNYSSTASNPGIVPADGDEKLNTGFVAGTSTFAISNIPYTNYDLYVYTLNDAPGRLQTTTLGGTSYYGAAPIPTDASHVDGNAGTPYVYTQATSTNADFPTTGADYVRFSGLLGSSQTFTASALGNGYVNGFQIVQSVAAVPEPSTWAMMFLGLGGIALSGWRMKRRDAAA